MGPDGLRATAEGRAWLARLPGLVARATQRWGLHDLGTPYRRASVSYTAPAIDDRGRPVVLKVQFPHGESAHEADALLTWAGDGAVTLLDHDRDDAALLLERCEPGTALGEVAAVGRVDPLAVLIGLLPRLWVPGGTPFRSAADEAASWAVSLRTRRASGATRGLLDDRVLDEALGALDDLAALDPTTGVLVHQDLHGDNVLAAARAPWLVIDPKPLIGPKELALAPIVRSPELGHGRDRVRRRLDRLTAELGLDRQAARRWALAQTLAWAFDADGTPLRTHLDVATWLAEP